MLPLLEEAGVEGYEMKARILFNFNRIRATLTSIERQKAQDKARK